MVDNVDFIKTIFQDSWRNAHVAAFSECADKPNYGSWKGNKVKFLPNEIINQPERQNTFFCISTFRDYKGGAYRRHVLHEATHAILIDDVSYGGHVQSSAKIPPAILKDVYGLRPTAVIETSLGNTQWIFAIQPEYDADLVKHFQKGIIDLQLTPDVKDPGLGDTTRYARLPIGLNNKSCYHQEWQHVVREWNPIVRTTIQEMAQSMGIRLGNRKTHKVENALIRKPSFPSELQNDKTLVALYKLNLVKDSYLDTIGRFNVFCPWESEHTQRDTTGAAYIRRGYVNEEGRRFMNGGFICHHAHCEGRSAVDLRAWLEFRGYRCDAYIDNTGYGDRFLMGL